MSVVNTYDPFQVQLVICDYPIQGITQIATAPSTKPFELIRGIRGVNTRRRSTDSSMTINFSVLNTSASNYVLNEIVKKDLLTNGARLTVALFDFNNGTRLQSHQAFLSNKPNLTFTTDFNDVPWEIQMLNCDPIVQLELQNHMGTLFNKAKEGISGAIDNLF